MKTAHGSTQASGDLVSRNVFEIIVVEEKCVCGYCPWRLNAGAGCSGIPPDGPSCSVGGGGLEQGQD